ncbi:MAG: nucleotidyltransferase domain-containing protein [Alphaproteobacteria bacterium]|nr:nucleotidyltransferase domain-containing protein [Alphaproteobacteria bacterium]
MNPSNPSLHQLSQQQLAVLRSVLVPFADKIDLVGLFGSRATGMARPNSDIDLVLYGDVESAVVDRLRTLFNDSLLSLNVDLHAYQAITYPALKQHIDAVMQPLFTQQELLASRG